MMVNNKEIEEVSKFVYRSCPSQLPIVEFLTSIAEVKYRTAYAKDASPGCIYENEKSAKKNKTYKRERESSHN